MMLDVNHFKYYLKLNEEKQAGLKLEPLNSANQFNNEILTINSENFLSIINRDTIYLKLIIFFTYWCPGSEEFLPQFLNNYTKSGDLLRIFLISPDDWVYKEEYLRYYNELDFKGNMYLLDVYSYGEKRNPHYRMDKFISEICTDCEEIAGFPSLILFDKENKIVFKETGAVTFDTIKNMIDKINI